MSEELKRLEEKTRQLRSEVEAMEEEQDAYFSELGIIKLLDVKEDEILDKILEIDISEKEISTEKAVPCKNLPKEAPKTVKPQSPLPEKLKKGPVEHLEKPKLEEQPPKMPEFQITGLEFTKK